MADNMSLILGGTYGRYFRRVPLEGTVGDTFVGHFQEVPSGGTFGGTFSTVCVQNFMRFGGLKFKGFN